MFLNFRILVILISLPAFLFFSCDDDSVQVEKTGSISGQVMDAVNYSGIDRASIYTSPPTSAITTDTDGKFTLADIPENSYTVSASKNGYIKSSVTVAVKDGIVTQAIILLSEDDDENNPPSQASNPKPANHSLNQSVSLTLSWHGSDQDDNDSLSYDIYLFKPNEAPVLLASELSDTILAVDQLEYNTSYHWQVNTLDAEGEKNNGDVWTFKTVPVPDYSIVYSGYFEDDYDIFFTDKDTLGVPFQLTNLSGKEWWPRFSPVKDKIAFMSNQEIENHIYTMNPDGSDITKITTLPAAGYHNYGMGFSWAENGARIIYPYYNKLYSILSSRSGLTNIASAPDDRHFLTCDWTPVNKKIVVLTVGSLPYESEIYLMDEDGSNMDLLVDDLPGCLGYPSFSPSGTKVIFTQDSSGFEVPEGRQLDSRIFVINIDGTDKKDISINKPDGTNDLYPRWSPDGSQIVFVNAANDGSNIGDIMIMDLSGSSRKKIAVDGTMPDWK